jgi:hypothetical protein
MGMMVMMALCHRRIIVGTFMVHPESMKMYSKKVQVNQPDKKSRRPNAQSTGEASTPGMQKQT